MTDTRPIIQWITDEAEANDVSSPAVVAAELIHHIARYYDMPVKVWQPGDLDDYLPDGLSEEEYETIRDTAAGSSAWSELGDCTNQEWELVEAAAKDALDVLGYVR